MTDELRIGLQELLRKAQIEHNAETSSGRASEPSARR